MNKNGSIDMKYIINISAPKTGTTYIFNCLKETNNFNIPKLKEPKYFLEEDLSKKRELPQGLHIISNKQRGFSWYNSLYDNTAKPRVDFTTLYNLNVKPIELPKDSNAIYIHILRDPFERLISHYFQYSKMGINQPPLQEIFKIQTPISEFYRSFVSSKKQIELYKDQNVILIDFNDIKQKDKSLVEYLRRVLNSKDFKFLDTGKYERGEAKSNLISKLLFNRLTSKISRFIPNSLYAIGIKVRKSIIRLNTKKPSNRNFELSTNNCYFYNDLVEEKKFLETLKYAYK